VTTAIVAMLVLVAAAVAIGLQWRTEQQQLEVARAITGGDASRAPALIRRFGCSGCHTIAGIDGADGQVAPSLLHLRQRVFIGGVLRNTPENLMHWIVAPQDFSPHSAMPATGIEDAEARDVAAYLYAH
jgi:cytochrome c